MLSSDELAGQGVQLYPAATPPSVNNGIVLNGTSQYATVASSWFATAFEGGTPGEITMYAEFTPNFDYTEAVDRALFDGLSGTNRYLIQKSAAADKRIYFYAGASTLLGWIFGVDYGPYWRVGMPNKVLARCVSGANYFYFNGVQYGLTNTAWTRTLPTGLIVGAAQGPSLYWGGTISDVRFYNRQLTAAEAIQLTTLT
jgi:hypothetical protein